MFYEMFTEKFINNKNAGREWEYMVQGFIPLTPSILQDFETDVDQAWHITARENLKNLKALQGKRKDIPTFKKGSSGLSYGASSGAEIIVNLTGKSSFNTKVDFFSQLDRNGHRWINPMAQQFSEYNMNNKFSVPMFNKIIKFLEKEFGIKTDRFGLNNKIKKFNGKDKAKFIKFYFDTSKKMLNSKMLKLIQAEITGSYDDYSSFTNDEILLHDFKINYVMTIIDSEGDEDYPYEDYEEDEILKTKKECKKLKLKYDGEMVRSDIILIDI